MVKRANRQSHNVITATRCFYCSRAFGSSVKRRATEKRASKEIMLYPVWDHIVPFVSGHNNKATNKIAVCHLCNLFKSASVFESIDDIRAFVLERWQRYLGIVTRRRRTTVRRKRAITYVYDIALSDVIVNPKPVAVSMPTVVTTSPVAIEPAYVPPAKVHIAPIVVVYNTSEIIAMYGQAYADVLQRIAAKQEKSPVS